MGDVGVEPTLMVYKTTVITDILISQILLLLSYNAKYITNLIRTSKGLRNFSLDSHDCVVMVSAVCNKHYLYLLKSKRFADTSGIPTKRYANP